MPGLRVIMARDSLITEMDPPQGEPERGLLPARYQRYPTEGFEPIARNKRGIPREFVTLEKGKRHLSRRRNAFCLLIDLNQLRA